MLVMIMMICLSCLDKDRLISHLLLNEPERSNKDGQARMRDINDINNNNNNTDHNKNNGFKKNN